MFWNANYDIKYLPWAEKQKIFEWIVIGGSKIFDTRNRPSFEFVECVLPLYSKAIVRFKRQQQRLPVLFCFHCFLQFLIYKTITSNGGPKILIV